MSSYYIYSLSTGGRKKKKIYSKMDVAGHNLLKGKNLSKILRGTKDKSKSDLYQCLYPGDLSRAETFDEDLLSGWLIIKIMIVSIMIIR